MLNLAYSAANLGHRSRLAAPIRFHLGYICPMSWQPELVRHVRPSFSKVSKYRFGFERQGLFDWAMIRPNRNGWLAVDRGCKMTPLVDTHAHLEMLSDIEEAVGRAKAARVGAIIAVGSNPESNLKVQDISRHYAGYVFPAFGLHPWDVPCYEKEGLSFLTDTVGECIALGEVGLDYWVKVDKALQRTVFERILSLAFGRGKPVMIHCRGAWADVLEAVERSGVKRAVFHWFTGPADVLKRLLDRGFLISASPAAAYSKAHREAVQLAPLESIVLETDSPVKYGGVESEPAHVLKSLKSVAELKGVEEEIVAERTTENAVRLLKI